MSTTSCPHASGKTLAATREARQATREREPAQEQEHTLHLARTQALGTECYFTAHGFLKALGRATGKQNHEWLKLVLVRLAGAVVEIISGRRTYFGTLIEGGVRDEDTGRYVVEINPSWRPSTARRSGRRSTGSNASVCVASPWRYGCTAFMPATPRPTR